MYSVNDKPFTSFFAAVAFAQEQGAQVVETATGTVRWEPAPESKKRTKHVMVDGREISKVKRSFGG